MTTKILIFILANRVAECRKRSEFIISSGAKHACVTWTARGLSRMQNSMRHKSLYEYILGVRQWLHVALRHRAFFVSRQHRLCIWWLAHFHVLFMKGSCVVYSSIKQCLQSVNHEQFSIHMTQNSKHNKWLEIFNFQPKHLWGMPTKIHRERGRRRQQEAAHKAQRPSLSTAKALSSTQRPQTCTEAAKKYYNYTSNGADQERNTDCRRFKKRWGDQATLTVYSKIIFLRTLCF